LASRPEAAILGGGCSGIEFELLEQELKIGLGPGATRKDDGPVVGGGKMNIDNLDRIEFLQDSTRI
jgi:hypothetical protein